MRIEYISLLLATAIIALLEYSMRCYRPENVLGRLKFRFTWLAAIVLALPMIYCAWQRPMHFGDTGNYFSSYIRLPVGEVGLLEYLTAYPKDFGYTVLIWMFKSIGLDFRTVLLIIASFQIWCLLFTYRKYSSSFPLSMLLFLLSTDYYSWMWNGMRQFIAASILFVGAKYVFEKRYISYSVLILLASTFHQSALIMLPAVYLVQGRPFNMKTLICIVGALSVLLLVDQFTDLLDSSLQGTQYANVISDYKEGVVGDDDGTNPFRVLVYSVPVLLAIFANQRLNDKNYGITSVSINMSIISMCIYLISMVSSGIFIGRLPIYSSLYNYILLPWEIKNYFSEKSRNFMLILMFLLYIIFYVYQVFFIW